MKRNEAIELLEKYNEFIEDEALASDNNGCDTSIKAFMETKWAKENILVKDFCLHKHTYFVEGVFGGIWCSDCDTKIE